MKRIKLMKEKFEDSRMKDITAEIMIYLNILITSFDGGQRWN